MKNINCLFIIALVMSNSLLIVCNKNNMMNNEASSFNLESVVANTDKLESENHLTINGEDDTSGTINLTYQYHIAWWSLNEYGRFRGFNWSFSTNPTRKVNVYAMAYDVYQRWIDGQTIYRYYTLLEQEPTGSGRWVFKGENHWAIVFKNGDPVNQTTNVTYSCDIQKMMGPWMKVTLSILGIIAFIIIAVVVAITVSTAKISSRKKNIQQNNDIK